MPLDTNARRVDGINDDAYELAHVLFIAAENQTYSNATEIHVAVSKAGIISCLLIFKIHM